MAFTHLLSPMKVGNKVYKNRIVSAPMAFSLVAQNPMAAEVSYRKLEGPAKGGNACVILGETDVNFRDAVRIPGFKPFDFAKPEEDMATFKAVKTYADRIKKHDCIALAELVHCGKEKVPFNDQQEAIGPVDCVNSAGVPVRAMTRMIWIVLQMISQWQLFICRKPDLTESSFMADMDLSLHSTFPH